MNDGMEKAKEKPRKRSGIKKRRNGNSSREREGDEDSKLRCLKMTSKQGKCAEVPNVCPSTIWD